eukprot:208258_1
MHSFHCDHNAVNSILTIRLVLAAFCMILNIRLIWNAYNKGLNKSHQTLKRIFNLSFLSCYLYFTTSTAAIILCFNGSETSASIIQTVAYAVYFTLIMLSLYSLF